MMNDYQMNNEFLKSVMEGMGVQPTDNMLDNWNTIMNFVPNYSGNYAPASNINGPIVKLIFEYMNGGDKIEVDCQESTLLKDALINFARRANITDESLNNISFLSDGRNLNFNTQGTIKSNNLKNGSKIVVVNLN